MGMLSRFFGPPSKDRFARLVAHRLRRAGLVGQLNYQRSEFSLRRPDGAVYYLGNAYAEYCRVEKVLRDNVLHAFVQGWASGRHGVPDDFEDVKHDLLPALRARTYIEVSIARLMADGVPAIPYEIVADSLCATLVYDLPKSMATISEDQLEKWGVSLYEAMEIAKANLLETTKSYAKIGTLYSMVNGDSYDASRLLLTDWFRQLELQGDPIAMVPNRETLLVAGSDDVEALETMLKIADEALKHERFISGIALRLADDAWEPWLPPVEHPLFQQFDENRAKSVCYDYEIQQNFLQERFERERRDVYVATCSAIQHQETGRITTFCTWTAGIPTMLPRTDEVLFVELSPDRQPQLKARATWSDVAAAVGHLLQPQEAYPPRYLVDSFPSPEELRQIGGADDGAAGDG
jgi:hypothetical protein